ncbi:MULTISPECIES: DUF2788 domain-containing protein [Alteromonadaceae]|jgi:uncharacterized membrane protein|uniref:DUF2788 domain-containing protein n=1 Tax=Brumicola blandensis TaxID=3075611 RepID=A0AAW8QWU6_9ALTE|nr:MULTISPECIES: DUF2788 domain-containing protein [unclassified Alteromonas]MDT0581628.1 DUF2788 domain-containing protein [Alteromonas sp. W409]MDT0627203.1 DUF2788 domain-containing protein [Alteromonas sp. W364]
MNADNYQVIESVVLNLSLVLLFVLLGLAIHDVLKKNDVPLVGKVVAYGVLGLGAAGFVAKGIIQLFYSASGVS